MNNLYIDEKKCTGCLACKYICSNDAIVLKRNNEGFLFPSIDYDRCTKCGRCGDVCQIYNDSTSSRPICSYGALSENNEFVKDSSSGGIFLYLSYYVIITLKGYVCGAYIDEKLSVKHIVVDNVSDLKKIQGSKYVESDLTGIYNQISDLIMNKEYVLFAGTPCQVGAVKLYFNEKNISMDRLILIDLVCQGVPSNEGFKKWMEKGYSIREARRISFRRHDDYNVNQYGLYVSSNYSTISVRAEEDPFYNSFLSGFSFRECCYSCQYARRERVGDITLGDCSNSRDYLLENPSLSNRSISMVLINTNLGERLWDAINERIISFEDPFDKECILNTRLREPAKRSSKRDRFYLDLELLNKRDFIKKYKKKRTVKTQILNICRSYIKSQTRWRVRGILYNIRFLRK